MIKNRIIYLLLLIGSIIYFIFANDSVSFAILFVLLFIPLVGIIGAIIESKRFKYEIKTKNKVLLNEKNDLIIKFETFFPCWIKTNLNKFNKLTKINESISYDLLLGLKKEYCVENINKCIGLIEYYLDNICFYDIFGLLKIKTISNYKTNCFCLFNYENNNIELENKIVLNENESYVHTSNKMESNEYSAYRKYIPGDSLKSINWKLSTKLNDLYVKINERSISKSILIVFSNEFFQETNENIILYFSIINELVRAKYDVTASYITNGLITKRILKDEDVSSLLIEMLEIDLLTIKKEDIASVKEKYSLILGVTKVKINDILAISSDGCERSK